MRGLRPFLGQNCNGIRGLNSTQNKNLGVPEWRREQEVGTSKWCIACCCQYLGAQLPALVS